jgi:hypothetical protein
MRSFKIVLEVLTVLMVTLFAAVLAVASGGAGHGHYLMARLLFPHSMLLTRLTGDTIAVPLIALALVQFPLYWIVVRKAIRGSVGWDAVALLGGAHAIAVVLCFSGMIPIFS